MTAWVIVQAVFYYITETGFDNTDLLYGYHDFIFSQNSLEQKMCYKT